jgi:hypothetical protein
MPEMIKSIMYRSLTLAALIFSISGICFAQNPLPVRDGFVLDGIDGKITTENGKWFFTVFEPITDGKGVLDPKIPIAILPSSMLEKFASTFSEEKNSYRIWGKLTKYQNKNFVYLSYFLPVAEAEEPKPSEDVNDANEVKIIPDEVLLLLKPKRVISLAELRKPVGTEADGILADRTGFLKQTKEGVYFAFDGMGRNIDPLQLPLLECAELESMAGQQEQIAMRLRFNISAIVTRYQGKRYLLLQRATRVFSHGNFAK